MKKKGFTLVELLVVIAILAILATVSILGYASFTKKANYSNDTTLLTEWNLSIDGKEVLAESDINEKLNNVIEVKEYFSSNGTGEDIFTPKSSGYHYYWCEVDNTIYLVDDSNDFTVKYPESTTVTAANSYRLDLEYYSITCSIEGITLDKKLVAEGETEVEITLTATNVDMPNKVKIGDKEYSVTNKKIIVASITSNIVINEVTGPNEYTITPTLVHSSAYIENSNVNPTSIVAGADSTATLKFKANANSAFLGDTTEDIDDIKKEINLKGADFVSWSVEGKVATLTIKNPTEPVTFTVPGKRTIDMFIWKDIYYGSEYDKTNCNENVPEYDIIAFKKLTSSDTEESVKARFDASTAVVTKDEDGKIDYVVGKIGGKSALYFFDEDKTYADCYYDSLFAGQSVDTSCIDFDNFSTKYVRNMHQWFSGCQCSVLDLSNFDTSRVYSMKEMFKNCKRLTMVDLSSFDMSHITEGANTNGGVLEMFLNCYFITAIFAKENADWFVESGFKDTIYNEVTDKAMFAFHDDCGQSENYGKRFVGVPNYEAYPQSGDGDALNFKYANTTKDGYLTSLTLNHVKMDLSASSVTLVTPLGDAFDYDEILPRDWPCIPSSIIIKFVPEDGYKLPETMPDGIKGFVNGDWKVYDNGVGTLSCKDITADFAINLTATKK